MRPAKVVDDSETDDDETLTDDDLPTGDAMHDENTQNMDEMEFSQWSQRCTLCYEFLWAGDELARDPRNHNHIVHDGCLWLLAAGRDTDE